MVCDQIKKPLLDVLFINGSNIEIRINAELLQKFKANWQKEVQGYIDSEKVKLYCTQKTLN